jgi:hypothetical protein
MIALLTFNLPSNFKNLVILIIVNMCIIFAVYSIYSDKSNNISPLYLKQKISAEEVVANNLQERLIILKNLFEAVDKFDLTEQVLNFKIIISVFDGIKAIRIILLVIVHSKNLHFQSTRITLN